MGQIINPYLSLRFINRDGAMILQQAWTDTQTGNREWHDIPVAEKCEECGGEGYDEYEGTIGVYRARCILCDGSGYR